MEKEAIDNSSDTLDDEEPCNSNIFISLLPTLNYYLNLKSFIRVENL